MRRLSFALLPVLAGCSLQRAAVRSTAGILDRGLPAVYEEPDPVFAEQALPAQLATIETLLRNDPSNVTLLEIGCQGYAGYALLFIEDENPGRARGFYKRARDLGLRALERRGFAGLSSLSPSEIESRLSRAGSDDVRALFWTAMAWAGWINLAKDDPAAVADQARAVALMAPVSRLDPGYFFGGPDLFFGVYQGRPRMFGGDFDKSRASFERAAAAAGGKFLLTWVKYARVYAVDVQDKALFKALLQRVLDAPADALPEARLANEVAKREAKSLMEKADDLFE